MRKRRHELGGQKKPERTEIFPGVILWEGTVYRPRGTRKKHPEPLGQSKAGELKGSCGATLPGVMAESPPAEGSGRFPLTGPDIPGPGKYQTDRWITPASDGAKQIFKGSVEEAVELPPVKYAYSILKQVFGGLYITSNQAESLFTVKPSLMYHRTVKSGDMLIRILLYPRIQLKGKGRSELRSFLMQEVMTPERMRRVAVRYGAQPRDNGEVEPTILNAYSSHLPVTIYYRDAKGRRTSRMIEPRELEVDPYTGGIRIRAYCHLRNAERTFLLGRIIGAIPTASNLSVVSCPSS